LKQAVKDPAAMLEELEEQDPFGVRIANVSAFTCPSFSLRLTLPNKRNMAAVDLFKEDRNNSFIFFQHLRKAGGTAFCDLANRNMRGRTPPYYCMPDERGTLATPPWNTRWLLKEMAGKKYRIAANEWDALTRSKLGIKVRRVHYYYYDYCHWYRWG